MAEASKTKRVETLKVDWSMLGLLVATTLFAFALAYAVVGHKARSAEASHILVAKESLAKDLFKQLSRGADFAQLAEKHSECSSASKGGHLGSFSKGSMVAEFEAIIFAPESVIGEVYGPVKTEFGYHLIKIHRRGDTPEQAAKPGECKDAKS